LKDVEKDYDEEISLIFKDAKEKLNKIDKDATKQKKQIVTDLAKSLEGKIPTDTISIEIINQLRGQVSERFVRECLDEKYKQKIRVDNARKQKQHQQEEEHKNVDKLAAVTPLNEEVEEDKNKALVILGVDGRTSFRKDENEPTTTDASTIRDNIVNETSYQLQQEQEQEQEQELKEEVNPDLMESSAYKEMYDENYEQEAPEKSSQFISADNIPSTSESSYIYDNDIDTFNDILPFEFFVYYTELQKFMASIFRSKGDNRKVWFNGKINKKTGVVVSSNLGRINKHQDESIDIPT
jgi:hypothetical protein